MQFRRSSEKIARTIEQLELKREAGSGDDGRLRYTPAAPAEPPLPIDQSLSANGRSPNAAPNLASQGPNSLRITSQVLPAAVSFSQNLSSGARSSSARAMM